MAVKQCSASQDDADASEEDELEDEESEEEDEEEDDAEEDEKEEGEIEDEKEEGEIDEEKDENDEDNEDDDDDEEEDDEGKEESAEKEEKDDDESSEASSKKKKETRVLLKPRERSRSRSGRNAKKDRDRSRSKTKRQEKASRSRRGKRRCSSSSPKKRKSRSHRRKSRAKRSEKRSEKRSHRHRKDRKRRSSSSSRKAGGTCLSNALALSKEIGEDRKRKRSRSRSARGSQKKDGRKGVKSRDRRSHSPPSKADVKANEPQKETASEASKPQNPSQLKQLNSALHSLEALLEEPKPPTQKLPFSTPALSAPKMEAKPAPAGQKPASLGLPKKPQVLDWRRRANTETKPAAQDIRAAPQQDFALRAHAGQLAAALAAAQALHNPGNREKIAALLEQCPALTDDALTALRSLPSEQVIQVLTTLVSRRTEITDASTWVIQLIHGMAGCAPVQTPAASSTVVKEMLERHLPNLATAAKSVLLQNTEADAIRIIQDHANRSGDPSDSIFQTATLALQGGIVCVSHELFSLRSVELQVNVLG
eukprot:symbB.v1.2.015875.t1/scaffold1199.1/size145752/2